MIKDKGRVNDATDGHRAGIRGGIERYNRPLKQFMFQNVANIYKIVSRHITS